MVAEAAVRGGLGPAADEDGGGSGPIADKDAVAEDVLPLWTRATEAAVLPRYIDGWVDRWIDEWIDRQ